MRCLRPPTLAQGVAVAAFSLLIAGCGGGGSPGVANVASPAVSRAVGPAAATTSRARAMHLAGQCVRRHGVPNFADPTVGSFDKPALLAVPSSVSAQALAACRGALDQAGITFSSSRPSVNERQIQKFLALARCIRSHGLPDFPDPDPTTGDFGRPRGISFPQLQSAARACRPLVNAAGLGMPTPGSSPSSGT